MGLRSTRPIPPREVLACDHGHLLKLGNDFAWCGQLLSETLLYYAEDANHHLHRKVDQKSRKRAADGNHHGGDVDERPNASTAYHDGAEDKADAEDQSDDRSEIHITLLPGFGIAVGRMLRWFAACFRWYDTMGSSK